jgi:hypothetical protein
MKKLATTFGLLALMLVVTSFTSPNETGGRAPKGVHGPNIAYETGGREPKGAHGPNISFENSTRVIGGINFERGAMLPSVN